jgi:hypothetical protein
VRVASATTDLAYLTPSALVAGELQLQTSGGSSPAGRLAHPRFFRGFLTEPEQGAQGLLAVAAVARARYYVPMTAQRLAAILDPVVTSDGAQLRFESFSGCCGVYARLDVGAEGLDGDVLERGTTNVDVNPPLQTALARVGGREPLHLSVGPDDLTVSTLDDAVVERRVTLPPRWLRGFAEAPVVLAGMDLRAEVDALEARRFLRSLPRSTTRAVLWAVPAGRGLRLTTRAVPGAVCIAGPERLEALQPLLRFATALRVYGPPADGTPAASAWEVVLRGARLTLTVSPDLSRGFSGEGGVLGALVGEDALDDGERVGEILAWLPGMSLDEVATASGLPAARAYAALLALGTAGRAGYDVASATWFSRELPYGTAGAEALNPRLGGARRLVEEGRMRRDGDLVVVQLDDHVQHVRLRADGASCTCHWWSTYRGRRGPCKHVLATQLLGWT